MNRILIAGTGRMGWWFVRLLRRDFQVAAYDKYPVNLPGPDACACLTDREEIRSFNPDLLLNCVGIDSTVNAFNELSGYLSDSCVISDIASLKENLHDYYLGSGRRFVSVHPMFGPTFASIDSLKGLNAIIIEESDSEGKLFFRRLFNEAGIRIYETSFSEHDRLMSEALSLPLLATILFASGLTGDIPAGTTYARHAAIAEGMYREEPELLARLLLNRFSLEKIATLSEVLNRLRRLIEEKDPEGVRDLIGEGRERFSTKGLS
ncbi:MAG: prephenate dehydrogenase/arogenate dehydrogenase family protein [Bacteroidales bacterium]|jgi:prephenate dehydrogenase|nr:prephenate dehydrogenase/arogenate dehydrogenase family protein [Bacteroidales bacterium]